MELFNLTKMGGGGWNLNIVVDSALEVEKLCSLTFLALQIYFGNLLLVLKDFTPVVHTSLNASFLFV